ncbi:MAG: J domain-containing protein [Spirochaetes bacterium]|nr:J domain-containing protein [Spirochaetota bacterium]
MPKTRRERFTSFARDVAVDHAATLALAILGFAAGIFGIATGAMMGAMIDAVRGNRSVRKALLALLGDPGAPAPRNEPVRGIARGALLSASWMAKRGVTPDEALPELETAIGLADACGKAFLSYLSILAREGSVPGDPASFASAFAADASPRARHFLASAVYAVIRTGGSTLDLRSEAEAGALLRASGVGDDEVIEARAASFPGYDDPWIVLDLPRGASVPLVRSAFRAASKRFHPDGPAPDPARFIAAKKAMDAIVGSKAPHEPGQGRG